MSSNTPTNHRKVTAGLFMSLDGVVESPQTWNFPYFSDEMGAVVGKLAADADTLLLGRKTYDEFAAHWPNQTGEMADAINGIDKLVASTTVTASDWNNTRFVSGDLVDALTVEKHKPGKNINLTGSITLTRELLRAGLVDELHLLVHPIVLGGGTRLFGEDGKQLPLKLTHSATFATGVVHLRYEAA